MTAGTCRFRKGRQTVTRRKIRGSYTLLQMKVASMFNQVYAMI
jgi:hypothetical protein